MNTFIIGVLVGISLFALIYSVVMLNKLHGGMILLHQNIDAQSKALQMAFLKINKIEKITENTMNASETFVDALRESAEQMMNMRPHLKRDEDDSEQFDDLRKSFEDGIRRIEEDDEDGDEEREDWNKK